MGAVYRVEHVRMGKIAAMKVLLQELAHNTDLVRRFCREAEIISRLSHPNSVQVFDFGQTDGALYLVMEYLPGESLGEILRREGPLSFDRVAPMAMQVLSALAEAHEKGVIHRDIKPDNIMVLPTRDGAQFVKVLDFGLAKFLESEEMNEITQRGALVGTPYYMSPEQVRSEDPDPRSDIYSFGAVLYKALTGVEPFGGPTATAVLTKHLTEMPCPLRQRRPDLNIDVGAEAIVLRAMAKRREDRYPTADAMREAIEQRWLEITGMPVEAMRSLSPTTPLPMGTVEPSLPREPALWEVSTARLTPGTLPPSPGALPPSQGPEVAATNTLTAPPTPGISQRSLVPPLLSSPENRLSREEVDAFERRLRWRRRLALFLPLGALLGGAIAAYVLFQRFSLAPPAEEVEPNNTPVQATVLGEGKPVRGHIGKRLSAEQSDRDFFRIPLWTPHDTRNGEDRRLFARVSGIPNIDLVLEIYDGQGHRLAHANDSSVGGGEELVGVRLGRGPYYLCVREVLVAGRQPTENVTDAYTLLATWPPATDVEEQEPNGTPERATLLPVGGFRVGTLGKDDVDVFRLEGAEERRVAVKIRTFPEENEAGAHASSALHVRLLTAARGKASLESPSTEPARERDGRTYTLDVTWEQGDHPPLIELSASQPSGKDAPLTYAIVAEKAAHRSR